MVADAQPAAPDDQPIDPPVDRSESPFVVGIGSSAGGLEALTALLPGLPTGLGVRYVVAQHMSPTHRSMMSQLLGRTTPMAVLDVTDGCRPAPDTVYVTPPNSNVVLDEAGCLRLLQPSTETVPKPSVNIFFASLAEVAAERAIGVVLSGTGSDGAVGLHAIKASGGYSIAQEPSGAKYDGMVRAAIEAGGVDWVLPAESIGAEIARIVQRHRGAAGVGAMEAAMTPATLQSLLGSLYAQTRIDFSGYKEATLLRRVERRMVTTGHITLDRYLAHARTEPQELSKLSQDMLISVTSFFRDRLAFQRLREELLLILSRKPDGAELRVWVAGCASGEEAYSVAIAIREALAQTQQTRRVQIFATDIDEPALVRARRGVYSASALAELEPSLLEAYFVPHADGYEVDKALRGLVMFARHNMVQDPPFMRLDLITCRNVMIYLQLPLQSRLLSTFHYALGEGGVLFLGRSEGVHGNESLFEPIDRSSHLFRRCAGFSRLPAGSAERRHGHVPRERDKAPTMDDVVQRALGRRFAPAAVLVDASGDVRLTRGDTSALLTLPEGRPGYQLMNLLRRELRPEAARLIRDAQARAAAAGTARGSGPDADPAPVVGRWRTHHAFSDVDQLRLSVQQLSQGLDKPMLLLCFERRLISDALLPGVPGAAEDTGTAAPSALEEELASTREHLYTVIEELETSNEESQSLNEEIQTANEELQSTNEELEASNEELQASNEELTTVNEELQVKSIEWQALNAELENIHASVDFVLLAFDAQSHLTRTNRAAQRQLGIDPTWLGKPVFLLPWPEGMPPLRERLERVQAHRLTAEEQLLDVGRRHWLMRLMPRLEPDGSCRGVLLQMVDNTRLHESEEAAARSHAQLRQLVDRSAQLVCICDPGGRLQMLNPEFERCHGLQSGQAVGRLATEVLPPERARSFRDGQAEAMRRMAPLDVEETLDVAGEPRHLLASYYPLLDPDGAVAGVCYQALDITRRKRVEAELVAAHSAKLAAEGMANTKGVFLANMSHEIRTPMNAVIGLSRLALEEDMPPVSRDYVTQVHQAAQALLGILDDVLDYSKMEAGELRFERMPMRLDEVLQRVVSLFAANAQQKGLSLAMDPLLGVPLQIVGDPLRLSQVLNNLVGNAVKFTESGSVRITVTPLEESEPGACRLRFAVRDTGIGVQLAARDSLFDAFTQGDSSITRRFGGTGLGLAISQRLVQMMDGRIGVDSEPGRGSEFWFTARFGLQDVEPGSTVVPAWTARPEPAAPVSTLALRAGGLQGLNILLAEDNALNQIVGQAVLKRLGLEVQLAENGHVALQHVASTPAGHYAAVLMDMHMPEMDGLQATREIRALPQGQRLPIIALTAAALTEDRDRCLAAGMDGFITKPLVPEQLVDVLRQVLRTGAPAAPSAPSARLPEVAGFDLPALLGRLQGDETLMWRVLREFARHEAATGALLGRLLAEGRHDALRLRAHELTGSAATIGATLVSRSSASLESALNAGLPADAMLKALQMALDSSLASLGAALV